MTALEHASPAARPRRFDPERLARWLRRATLLGAGVAAVWFFRCFGTERVPAGMDGVASIPPGSLCIVDRRGGSAAVGHHVFADVPGGGTVLSRVAAVEPDGTLVLHNSNAGSAMPDSRAFGPLPRSRVRGVVLVVFPPEAPSPGQRIDGR
jgi:hypothetical protein